MGKVIAHVHGALDVESAQELQDRLIDVIDGQGNRSLIIDLTLTTFIDSLGLSVLFDAWRRMHDRGGEFMLSGPKNDVARVILASGLQNVGFCANTAATPSGGRCRVVVRQSTWPAVEYVVGPCGRQWPMWADPAQASSEGNRRSRTGETVGW